MSNINGSAGGGGIMTDKLSASERRSSARRAAGRTTKILLVEDEASLLEITSSLLSENGYSVFEASTAEEALEIFNRTKGRLDMLLSDINLPGISGIQLAEELVAYRPGMKVLLMTGNPYTNQGVLNYRLLEKPYRLTDMLDSVKDALKERR